jgi:hypothetical protein
MHLRRKRLVQGFASLGAAAVMVMLSSGVALASLGEGKPELYTNGIKDSTTKVEQVGYGEIELKSSELPGGEIECVNLGFGTGWNEGERAHGQILTWVAAGHASQGTRTELSQKCRGLGGSAWATDEPPLETVVEGKGKRGTSLSVPWNIVGVCGEVEEERVGRVQIGYPTGEEPPVHACKSEEEEKAEIAAEHSGHTHCYKEAEGSGHPEPAGCINVTIVDPTAALEIPYGGSLRPRWINGAGNGLDASKWEWETEQPERVGVLFCQLLACAAPGRTNGEVKTVGYEAQELIQSK